MISNGFISFGTPVTYFTPLTFPLSFAQIIAPYWTDIDLTVTGSVRYSIITKFHPTLSCLLELTSDYISSREGVQFKASWMLVAHWMYTCPYGNNTCSQVRQILKYNITVACIVFEGNCMQTSVYVCDGFT